MFMLVSRVITNVSGDWLGLRARNDVKWTEPSVSTSKVVVYELTASVAGVECPTE